MKNLFDISDSVIHAIQIVSKSIAFLLGIHLYILLHFVRFFSTQAIGSLQSLPSRRRLQHTFLSTTSRRVSSSRRRRAVIPPARRAASPRLLHLPALEPRPPLDEQGEETKTDIVDRLASCVGLLGQKLRDEILNMLDLIEAQGGRSGKIIAHVRHNKPAELRASVIQRLPPEIATNILVMASESMPTTICLLSKLHYRLVVPRLYASVELSDPRIFLQFRRTMAVHNPDLGTHVKSLSVASNSFDHYGYLPESLAESAALGVGIEQILLTTPNVLHLYLDLFALAALHDGTASRLQKGALPITLTTEYAAPQYLALPLFDQVRHLELNIFGLDKTAVGQMRKALPNVKSLTLRWVTRQAHFPTETETYMSRSVYRDHQYEHGGEVDGSDDSNWDTDDDEDQMWRNGGHRRNDFDMLVEALDLLRNLSDSHLPAHADAYVTGEPLEIITLLVWPKALRRLSQHYRLDSNVHVVPAGQHDQHTQKQMTASKSDLDSSNCSAFRPCFDRPSRRLTKVTGNVIVRSLSHSSNLSTPVSSPTPLYLSLDQSYLLGPRRGPLESWCVRHV